MALERIYAAGANDTVVTTNDGISWFQIPVSLLAPTINANWSDIMADPNDKDRVIVTGRRFEFPNNPFPAIAFSANNGAIWSVPIGDWDDLPYQPIWGDNPRVNCLWWGSTNTIYAAGTNSGIVKSIDSGSSFNAINKPQFGAGDDDGEIFGLYFTDDNNGIVSPYNRVYITANGGTSWTALAGNATLATFFAGSIFEIWMTNDFQTIVVCGTEGIATSIDGGVTFVMSFISTLGMRHIDFQSQTVGYGIELDGGRVKTLNSGVSWSVQDAGSTPGTNNTGIMFYDSATGVWISNNNIFLSNNGGLSGGLSYTDVGLNQFSQVWLFGGPFDPCFDLISCSGTVPNILAARPLNVGVDLLGNVGNVIKIDGDPECYTVQLGEAGCIPTYIVNNIDFIVGQDCAPFTHALTIPMPPIVLITQNGQMEITITNNSINSQNYTFALNGCSPDATLVTPSPINIAGGGTGVIIVQYTPLVVETINCSIDIFGPCSLVPVTYPIVVQSLAIPACPHYEISITGPSCAPDCIIPGSAIIFDIGGTLSPAIYPTQVTFNVVNQITQQVVYSQSWIVNNDAELDALQVAFVAPEPGQYCAEICLPGCNAIRQLCFTICEPFDIYKDECYKYHVHRPHNDNRDEYLVTIQELEGEILVENALWDTNTEQFFNFTVPGDGIYIFYMKDPVTGDTIYSFAAIETCDLIECWKNMMEKIMCSCSDPCCKKCSGPAQQEREFARMTLNKLVPLFMQYLTIAKHWEVESVGIKFLDEDRMCFLFKANQILDKIQDLTKDCGCNCNEDKSTASSRGDCLSC